MSRQRLRQLAIGMFVYRNVASQVGVVIDILPPQPRYRNSSHLAAAVRVRWKKGRESTEFADSLGDVEAAIADHQQRAAEFARHRDLLAAEVRR